MPRRDDQSLLARAKDRHRGPGMPLLGLSLALHGAALVGFGLLREAKPPEPYAIVAVALVPETLLAGLTASTNSDSAATPSQEKIADVAPVAPAQDKIAAAVPVPPSQEKIADTREIEMPPPADTKLWLPPAPSLKPLIRVSSTDTPSSAGDVEDIEARMVEKSEMAGFAPDSADMPVPSPDLQISKLGAENEASTATVPATVRGGRASNTAPRYPYLARKRGQEGQVVVRIQVSTAGTAADVIIHQTSGYRLLDAAAVEAVKTWHFTPANRGGISVAGFVDVPVSFTLTD